MRFVDRSDETLPAVIRPRMRDRIGILIHETDGYDSLSYLMGGSLKDGRRVSADYHIDRAGNITQITPAGYYAFHAGVSRHLGYQEPDKTVNQGYIGIELENKPDTGQVIETEMYIALAWLLRRLISAWYISFERITGHGLIALPAGRRSDPETLNWSILTQELITPSLQQNLYVVGGELS